MQKNCYSSEDICIFAYDNSGSTKGVQHYFKKSLSYLNMFGNITTGFECIYLLWNDQCKKTDPECLIKIFNEKKTSKGTNPELVCQWIIDNQLKDKNIYLWLISDGKVSEASKKACEKLNHDINYRSFSLVLINKIVDISIAFVFANNNSDHCDYKIHIESDGNYQNLKVGSADFDFDSIKKNNFEEKFKELLDFAAKRFNVSDYSDFSDAMKKELERQATLFIKELKDKRDILISEIPTIEINVSAQLDDYLKISRNDITDKIKSLNFNTEVKHGEQQKFITNKVNFLISSIHNWQRVSDTYEKWKKAIRKRIFSEKVERAIEEVPDVDMKELSTEVNFQDCLSLDKSNSPIICLNAINYIMDLLVKNHQFFIQILDYPFVLIENTEFLKKNSFICQTYDCETFKEYIKHNKGAFPINDPITRSELIGGIIPYEFANAWNDYSISCIFLNKKKVKQSFNDFFYFVLYKKLEVIESIDRSVIDQLKIYSFDRIMKGKSLLTLSSLPLEPKYIVPIPIALLYCVQISSEIHGEDPAHFKLEKLRYFCFTSEYIIEILRFFKMDIDEDFIRKRSELFQTLIQMKGLDDYKRLEFVLGAIFKVEDGYLINEIVAPEKLHMLAYLDQDMTKVAVLKDVTLESIQDKLKFYYSCVEMKPYTIYEETCRPKYIVNGLPFYNQLLKSVTKFSVTENSIEGVPITSMDDNFCYANLLSLCKIYIASVSAKKNYPTLEEFKQFVLKKKQKCHNKDKKIGIFPAAIMKDLKEIHEYYEPIATTISVKDFIERARKSCTVWKRKEMETEY